MCTHTHIHTHARTHTCTRTHTRTHTNTHAHIHTHTLTQLYKRTEMQETEWSFLSPFPVSRYIIHACVHSRISAGSALVRGQWLMDGVKIHFFPKDKLTSALKKHCPICIWAEEAEQGAGAERWGLCNLSCYFKLDISCLFHVLLNVHFSASCGINLCNA